jgi:hypothetical protein
VEGRWVKKGRKGKKEATVSSRNIKRNQQKRERKKDKSS